MKAKAKLELSPYELETLFLILSNHVHTRWRMAVRDRVTLRVTKLFRKMRAKEKGE